MIHYHGGPITPVSAAIAAWTRRHACVSFAYPDQMPVACEVAQSVICDNGAFTAWKNGEQVNIPMYAEWVNEWYRHPAFDWCLIPDIIDGSETDNDRLITEWPLPRAVSVPVWHLHESMQRLEMLCNTWQRVAIGSSGQYASIGTDSWWRRMSDAMTWACDSEGYPRTKLHGLRMLNPTIYSQFPFSSCDSTNVARNIGLDQKWKGTYQAMTKETRAMILTERIELHASAARWAGSVGTQMNFELVG